MEGYCVKIVIKRYIFQIKLDTSPIYSTIINMSQLTIKEPQVEVLESKDKISNKMEQDELALIRERHGLTYEQLCATVAEGLRAETILINKDTRAEVGRIPNHSTRAKFAPLAAELIPGAKVADAPAQKCGRIIIELPDGTVWNPLKTIK
jgi:hypothetical protein